MQFCKICGERLSPEDKFRGTCKDCESAVTKLIATKMRKGFYTRKSRLKFL